MRKRVSKTCELFSLTSHPIYTYSCSLHFNWLAHLFMWMWPACRVCTRRVLASIFCVYFLWVWKWFKFTQTLAVQRTFTNANFHQMLFQHNLARNPLNTKIILNSTLVESCWDRAGIQIGCMKLNGIGQRQSVCGNHFKVRQ